MESSNKIVKSSLFRSLHQLMTCQFATILHVHTLPNQRLKLSWFYQLQQLPFLLKLLLKFFALLQVFNFLLFLLLLIWLNLLSDFLGMKLEKLMSFSLESYFLSSFILLLGKNSLELITISFGLLGKTDFFVKHLLFSCFVKFLLLSLLEKN